MHVVMKVLQDKGAIHSVNEGSSFPLPHLHNAWETHFCSFTKIIRVHISKHITRTAWQATKSPSLHCYSAKQTTIHVKEKKHFPMGFSFTWDPLSISCKPPSQENSPLMFVMLEWGAPHLIWTLFVVLGSESVPAGRVASAGGVQVGILNVMYGQLRRDFQTYSHIKLPDFVP